MYYYKVALLGSILEPLTYSFSLRIPPNTLVEVPLRSKIKQGVVITETEKPSFETSCIENLLLEFFSQEQMLLVEFISKYYFCSLGEALGICTPFSKELTDSPFQNNKELSITLTTQQQKALQFLQCNQTSLLFGDTGSGKTEIYMSYFDKILREKKRVIFLMPEISLTPQMQKRLEEHFGSLVVMWHSKLTPKQKKEALQKIHSGEACIIAGPRSALFLPVKDLGLIVVDEEHDESYKASNRPRYNARDVAIYMGKLYGIHVVLGSATPTLSSYQRYPHFRLKGRHFETTRRFIYEESVEQLSPFIIEKLKEKVEKKEQSIIFLPTRANFKYLQCSECGESFECPFCSVGMSLHVKLNALKCHYCGYTQAIPKKCPNCLKDSLISSRLGTAQVVKELQEYFHNAVIEQFDRDTVTTQAKLKKILKKFNDKEIDILVGTQMLSKGHDYHGITLAVVLGMDNMLGMGDYRAREKALSSLIQIAGRSGRKSDAEVVVQTFNKEFFSAFVEDYEAFLEDEKFYREGLYPPYKRLARILFSHKNGSKAKTAMEDMKERLLRLENLVEVVGSGECAINKVANKYRYEILLRSSKATNLIKAIKASKVELAEVDMDPLEFS